MTQPASRSSTTAASAAYSPRRRYASATLKNRSKDDSLTHPSQAQHSTQRWATHGAPTEINAHPHTDDTGRIAIVHNGIVQKTTPRTEKKLLEEKGTSFKARPTPKRLAMLIGDLYAEFKEKNHLPPGVSLLQRSVQAALREVEGTYGIAVVCRDEPDTLIVARKGSPLIIGVGSDEYVVASDASAN